jgi:hypothetical protein
MVVHFLASHPTGLWIVATGTRVAFVSCLLTVVTVMLMTMIVQGLALVAESQSHRRYRRSDLYRCLHYDDNSDNSSSRWVDLWSP